MSSEPDQGRPGVRPKRSASHAKPSSESTRGRQRSAGRPRQSGDDYAGLVFVNRNQKKKSMILRNEIAIGNTPGPCASEETKSVKPKKGEGDKKTNPAGQMHNQPHSIRQRDHGHKSLPMAPSSAGDNSSTNKRASSTSTNSDSSSAPQEAHPFERGKMRNSATKPPRLDPKQTALTVDFMGSISFLEVTDYLRGLFLCPSPKYELIDGQVDESFKAVTHVHLSFQSAARAAEFMKTRTDKFEFKAWLCTEDEFSNSRKRSLMEEFKTKAQFLIVEHQIKVERKEEQLLELKEKSKSKKISLEEAASVLQEIDAIESQRIMLLRQ
ncbi:hypothetical protein CAPTEDRAFT_189862, partial [Capitella teleta]